MRSGQLFAVLLLAVLAAGFSPCINAHPLAPALLEMHELAPAKYSVLWRTSVMRAQGSDVSPVLPADCSPSATPQSRLEAAQAVATRWVVNCGTSGLTGKTIHVDGLESGSISVILRIEGLDGRVVKGLLTTDEPDFRIGRVGDEPPVFLSYLQLGIGHLLTGFDHVLFLSGLLLLVSRPRYDARTGDAQTRRRLRQLLITVTAFTLGHSITLSLASLGLIHVQQAYAELAIAATILVLACQLASPAVQASNLFVRKPWVMAFSFGLLHGLGFAGALADIGLPQGEIPLALFSFNVGIELGQLVLVTLALLLVVLWRSLPQVGSTGVQEMARTLSTYLIGSFAALWCLERAALLIGA